MIPSRGPAGGSWLKSPSLRDVALSYLPLSKNIFMNPMDEFSHSGCMNELLRTIFSKGAVLYHVFTSDVINKNVMSIFFKQLYWGTTYLPQGITRKNILSELNLCVSQHFPCIDLPEVKTREKVYLGPGSRKTLPSALRYWWLRPSAEYEGAHLIPPWSHEQCFRFSHFSWESQDVIMEFEDGNRIWEFVFSLPMHWPRWSFPS